MAACMAVLGYCFLARKAALAFSMWSKMAASSFSPRALISRRRLRRRLARLESLLFAMGLSGTLLLFMSSLPVILNRASSDFGNRYFLAA